MMMRKISTIALLLAVATQGRAASDRIDFVNPDGSFSAIVVEDIARISYAKADDAKEGDGYSTMVITMTDGTVRSFSLTEFPRVRYSAVDSTPFEITAVDADNATITMLYNHNKPDQPDAIDPTKPYGWRGSVAGGPVFYFIDPKPGFEADEEVVGLYSGKVYSNTPGFTFISLADDNKRYSIGLDCRCFMMPFEPVEIRAKATELSAYPDSEFAGTYSGYVLASPAGRLRHGGTMEFTADIRPSGAYYVTTTDGADKRTFADLYTYNPDANTLEYVERVHENEFQQRQQYVLNGALHDGGIAFFTVKDLIDGRPESARHYIASKAGFDVTLASIDDNGYKCLLEVTPNGLDRRYWFTEEYGSLRYPATVEFISGSSIASTCEALVSYRGEVRYKYVVNGTSNPQFIARGAEAGTFVNGSGSTLVLDGFGAATLDGTSGTYTFEGGIVTLLIGSDSRLLVVDTAAGTFADVVSDAWDGAATYESNAVVGSLRGAAVTNYNHVDFTFDKNLVGADRPGYVAINIKLMNSDRFTCGTYLSACPKYTYNAAEGTIILTRVLVGDTNVGFQYLNLTLHVSDDRKTIWFDSDPARIYTMDRTGSYILTGPGNTYQAN